MLALAHTFTIDGLEARHVTVELDVRGGLPSFRVVGMAASAASAMRERVQTAIRNSGFEWPKKRITANVAPGTSTGAGLDLAVACAVLAATEQAPSEPLSQISMYGELGLDGTVRPAGGTLAAAEAALRCGLDGFGCARERAGEAALVDGLTVAPLADLTEAVRVLSGARPQPVPAVARRGVEDASEPLLDLADVRGCQEAVRALVIAAAGGHNLLLFGPPGVGKTMLARRLPGILPPLDPEEAVELGRLESVRLGQIGALDRPRPFRAPHHSITPARLAGSEVTMAHRGVLFLDELAEFSRPALDSLRQPVEDGFLRVAGGLCPCRFMLVCATNPCPCGYAEQELGQCTCSARELTQHRRKLNGPLLDRIDLAIGIGAEADRSASPPVSSAEAGALIAAARARQSDRLKGREARTNAEMDARLLRDCIRLDSATEAALTAARRTGLVSVRGAHRAVKVARTLADLAGREQLDGHDLATALALRGDRRAGRLSPYPPP
jgi:magnesium chelatase family protein